MDAVTPYPLQRNAGEHARLAMQAEFWSADAAALFDSAPVPSNGQVADLGCGTLHVPRLLRRLVGDGGRVFAVDNDATLLADARAACERGIAVVQGDAYGLGWPAASIDAVHARFLAAPAGRLDVLIAEMRRVLRPGGLLMLQEPVADGWSIPAAGAAWPRLLALIRAGFARRGGNFDAGGQLTARLEAAGAICIRTRTVTHRMPVTHPYASLPLAFCDSLAPLWHQEGMVSDTESAELRAALARGLQQAGATVTTFALVQAWCRCP